MLYYMYILMRKFVSMYVCQMDLIILKEMLMFKVLFCFMIKVIFIQIFLFIVIVVSLLVVFINYFVSMYVCLFDIKLRVIFFGLVI